MPKLNFKVNTDANGYFQATDKYNPPGPFTLTVTLTAKLLNPADTTVIGSLDIDAADGNPSNQEKQFQGKTTETIQLGQWTLDGGDNIVVLQGRTEPARKNTTLNIEVNASL